MPNVQIKDVPEETHRILRQRAADAHQSLQEYLRAHLIAEASQPTMHEVLAQAAHDADSTIGFADVVEQVRGDRDRH